MNKALKALEQLRSIPDPSPSLAVLIDKLEHRINHPPQPHKLGRNSQLFLFEKCAPTDVDAWKYRPGMAFAIACSKEEAIAFIMENARQDLEVFQLDSDIRRAIRDMFSHKLQGVATVDHYNEVIGVDSMDLSLGIMSLQSRSELRAYEPNEQILKDMEVSLHNITPLVLPFTYSTAFFTRGVITH